MHDHATDGGLVAYHDKASARDTRLHLDNAHDYMTTGWTYDRMVERHVTLHAAEDRRLAEIRDAAAFIAERLNACDDDPDGQHHVGCGCDYVSSDDRGPGPGVAEAIAVAAAAQCWRVYLTDANGTLYRAEHVDPRHMPAAGDLYRLTVEAPAPADIVGAMEASIAATRAYLDANKASGAIPSEAPAGASGPAAVAPHAAPSSTAAPNLLRDGVEPGAAVDPNVGGGGPSLPCRSDRLAPSGSTGSGGAS